MVTHEQFIAQVAALATSRLTPAEFELTRAIKLVYGAGNAGLRGVTYYNRWSGVDAKKPVPFVEVCAFGQSSIVQLAGTTIHELGHVLEDGAGHSQVWKDACGRMGLRRIMAAGTAYKWSMFEASLREAICALPVPDDGEPVVDLWMGGGAGQGGLGFSLKALKPCTQGVGTRGGMSRGKGSGSRMLLYHCGCVPPVKIRAARPDLACTCDLCREGFTLV